MNRVLIYRNSKSVAVPSIDHLIEASWWNDVDQSKFGGYRAYHSTVMSLMTNGPRVEGYLLNGMNQVIAMVFMQRTMDIHYGLVATPITVIIEPGYRGDRQVVRALSSLVKDVVRKLDCKQYFAVKHLSRTQAVQTLRSL